jgi:2-succinyl-5-enolpyruvyl-6-hydroxy-3-cyclohexene-1-carboxylate synthase
VLLNNDGGGIFHFLPVATQRDAFEEHVATPHGLDFETAAALYGCGYRRPPNVEALRQAVEEATGRTTIIEVRTDRDANLALHRAISDTVIEAVSGASG